jgi:predicted transcriptional regulator of viral defense system
MRATEAYGELLGMNRVVVTTREAATRWQTEQRTAGRRLRALEEAGLVRRLRRGLWALGSDVEPFALAPYLTAPLPAYVSLWSALSHHGMIEQIPRRISVVSLDRSRSITTALGTYTIHHLAPELFGGYRGSEKTGYLAAPEKALFDTVYVRSAAGSRAFLPELSIPADFDNAQLKEWTGRIKSARLQTIVSRRLREVLRQATREGANGMETKLDISRRIAPVSEA